MSKTLRRRRTRPRSRGLSEPIKSIISSEAIPNLEQEYKKNQQKLVDRQNNRFIDNLIARQTPSEELKTELKRIKGELVKTLKSELQGVDVRFKYAGSYRKGTMIKESFDLDLVVSYPKNSNLTIEDVFLKTKEILERKGYQVIKKNVALRINQNHPTFGKFHIDVVPFKSSDEHHENGFLWKSKEQKIIKTNIKQQVTKVTEKLGSPFSKNPSQENKFHSKVFKFIKIWKAKNDIECPTFVMEQMYLRYMESRNVKNTKNTFTKFKDFSRYISDNIETIRLTDPANSNNIVSDLLSKNDKSKMKIEAERVYKAKYASDVFNHEDE